MASSKVKGIAGVLVAFALAQPTFAGPKFADYPARKASECAFKADKAGLFIGIQPMEDVNDQKNYFSSDLKQKGFIPVYVVIENQSSGDSFLFDKTGVKIGVGSSVGAGPDANTKSVETLQVVSALAISPVGLIIGAKLAKDQAAVQTNLVKREVQSKTLSPGATTSGFLYIPVPKDGARQPLHLKILITRSGDDDPFGLDFNFLGERP